MEVIAVDDTGVTGTLTARKEVILAAGKHLFSLTSGSPNHTALQDPYRHRNCLNYLVRTSRVPSFSTAHQEF